ncbi:MAG: SDR family oxidoreductase [Acidobacteria bacterium]|nr:SDR family oxidoreductase [Acidobacteriota bacterium]
MKRCIVVTGASRGIGRAVAVHLAKAEGAHLVLLGRKAADLEEGAGLVRAAGGTAEFSAGDVRDRTWLQTLARDLDQVDALVAAAGISGITPVDKDCDDRFESILGTNVTGAWNAVRAFAPRMKEGGHIALVSSVLGHFGVPAYGAYCASKAALLGLTRALALELVDRGIFVNAVAPGWVDTDMAVTGIRDLARALGVDEAEARRRAERAVPAKRFFRPEEIAHGVAWLLHPSNTMMVGKCLTLDGGSVQT